MTNDDLASFNAVLEHADEPTRKFLLKKKELIESYGSRIHALGLGLAGMRLHWQHVNEIKGAYRAYQLELARESAPQS